MAPIEIYGMPPSPPCRILMMTCEVLGLKYELKRCNIMEGDNQKPEYLKVRFCLISKDACDISCGLTNDSESICFPAEPPTHDSNHGQRRLCQQ